MNLGEFKGLLIQAGIDSLDENVLSAFINAGQKMCDRLADYPHTQGRLSFEILAGDYFLVFPVSIRLVHGVWIRDTEVAVGGTPLYKTDLTTLRGLYPQPDDSTFFGLPKYYAHMQSILAGFGSPTVDELAMPVGSIEVSTSDTYDYKGLVLGPSPDGPYFVDVLCTAYTKALVDDGDESFWTKHYPEILLNAVMFKVEGFLRNTSSATSYFQALQNDIRYLNYDAVDDEMRDKPNIAGY